MAAREALEAEPDTAENAETFDGLVGILGAGGFEAARAGKEDGQVGLVAADGEQGSANGERRIGTGHNALSSCKSSVVSEMNGAVATLGLG